MRRPRVQIEYLSGPEDGKIVGFSKETVTIGRSNDCDICLTHDETVSRRHARLLCEGGRLFIEDTGSTHGTFVHGQRIQGRAELTPGALIRVGQSWLRIPG
ncbi:MAG: FHA domain-containing protein [Armatimonadetes bacterium]|nr:FHA domain-containing protein [Armatimonadota bacterium]